jgi:hypothetical protein
MKTREEIIEFIEESHFSLLIHQSRKQPQIETDGIVSAVSHERRLAALQSRIDTCLSILTDDEAEAEAIAIQCYESARQRHNKALGNA